jgi:hypothetical protein
MVFAVFSSRKLHLAIPSVLDRSGIFGFAPLAHGSVLQGDSQENERYCCGPAGKAWKMHMSANKRTLIPRPAESKATADLPSLAQSFDSYHRDLEKGSILCADAKS